MANPFLNLPQPPAQAQRTPQWVDYAGSIGSRLLQGYGPGGNGIGDLANLGQDFAGIRNRQTDLAQQDYTNQLGQYNAGLRTQQVGSQAQLAQAKIEKMRRDAAMRQQFMQSLQTPPTSTMPSPGAGSSPGMTLGGGPAGTPDPGLMPGMNLQPTTGMNIPANTTQVPTLPPGLQAPGSPAPVGGGASPAQPSGQGAAAPVPQALQKARQLMTIAKRAAMAGMPDVAKNYQAQAAAAEKQHYNSPEHKAAVKRAELEATPPQRARLARAAGLKPGTKDWNDFLKGTHKRYVITPEGVMDLKAPGGVPVNVGAEAARKHEFDLARQKERQGRYAKQLTGYSEGSTAAQESISTIREARAILEGGFEPGAWAPQKALLGRMATAFGIDPEEIGLNSVSDYETFTAMANKLTQKMTKNLKGGLSEKELDFLVKSTISPTSTKQTNLRIMSLLEKGAKKAAQKYTAAQDWEDEYGTLGNKNKAGDRFEAAWRKELNSGGDENTPPAAPKVGEVKNGFRFKGGNPADPNSWERK